MIITVIFLTFENAKKVGGGCYSKDKRWHYAGKCIPFTVCILQFMSPISYFFTTMMKIITKINNYKCNGYEKACERTFFFCGKGWEIYFLREELCFSKEAKLESECTMDKLSNRTSESRINFHFCSTFTLKMFSEMSERQKDLHWCFSFILLVIYLNAKPTNGQCCSWSLISRWESNFSQKFCISHVYSASFLAPFHLFPPFCKISIVILRAVKYSFKFVQKI